MSVLAFSDMNPGDVADIRHAPRNVIRDAVSQRCESLGLTADQTRQCINHALDFYPNNSKAWCIREGVGMAYGFMPPRRTPTMPEPA